MQELKIDARLLDEVLYYGVAVWRRMDLHGPGEEHLLSRTLPWSGVCPEHQGTQRILEFHLTDCWQQIGWRHFLQSRCYLRWSGFGIGRAGSCWQMGCSLFPAKSTWRPRWASQARETKEEAINLCTDRELKSNGCFLKKVSLPELLGVVRHSLPSRREKYISQLRLEYT